MKTYSNIIPEGDISRHSIAEEINGTRYYSGAKTFRGEKGALFLIRIIKQNKRNLTDAEITKIIQKNS